MNFICVVLLTMFWKSVNTMRCYYCDADRAKYGSKPCLLFNTSEAFMVDCPSSTMCFKKVINLDMGNGLTASTIDRGCAAQTLRDEQRKVGRTWKTVKVIYEVYEESCVENGDEQRTTSALHCYCRGDLCNDSATVVNNIVVTSIGLICGYVFT